MLVDSHCHLNYLDDPDACLNAAREQQIGAFLCIGVDHAGSGAVLALAERHQDVWATVGLHPDSAGAETTVDWIERAAEHARVVAIGETGLDYFRLEERLDERLDKDADDARRRQRDAFAAQLELARQLTLPIVVHTRAAEADTRDLIRAAPDVTGVLHCFTGSWDLARLALDRGYYVSISGIVTFRNADNVRDVARRVPADRLLVETDCPYLAPMPVRGRTNEPAYLVHTAKFLAELRGADVDRLAAQTTENFYRLFAAARSAV